MSSSRPAPRLPPGFRFHPTDEELVVHYLKHKAASSPIPVSIITDIELYKFDPWDLPSKANFGEKEWYFFSPRDRKYPNGARPNRAAASGYWKATGTDKPILTPCGDGGHTKVGVKKVLVFYKGRPPKGIKTNWIMHEYRLVTESKRPASLAIRKSHRLDDWVLCRIYRKAHSQNISLDESFPGVEETIPMSSSSVSTISPQPSMEDTKLANNLPRLGSFGALLSDPFYLNMDSLYTDNASAEGASKHNTFNIPPSRDPNGPTQRNVFQPTLLQEPDGTFRWPFLENKHQIQNLYTNVHRDYI